MIFGIFSMPLKCYSVGFCVWVCRGLGLGVTNVGVGDLVSVGFGVTFVGFGVSVGVEDGATTVGVSVGGRGELVIVGVGVNWSM